MEKHGTRYLPVVRDDRWVGMLAMRDIMRVELSEQGAELRLLHEYIQH
jgi:CBS domain-containing protein